MVAPCALHVMSELFLSFSGFCFQCSHNLIFVVWSPSWASYLDQQSQTPIRVFVWFFFYFLFLVFFIRHGFMWIGMRLSPFQLGYIYIYIYIYHIGLTLCCHGRSYSMYSNHWLLTTLLQNNNNNNNFIWNPLGCVWFSENTKEIKNI